MLQALREEGVEVDVIDYLKSPLDRAALTRLVKQVGADPSVLLRRKDPKFRAAGLDPGQDYSASKVVQVLGRHPELMERPVAVKGRRALVVRPPDRFRELL